MYIETINEIDLLINLAAIEIEKNINNYNYNEIVKSNDIKRLQTSFEESYNNYKEISSRIENQLFSSEYTIKAGITKPHKELLYSGRRLNNEPCKCQ